MATVHVDSADQMLAACLAAGRIDIAVCAAAVADWKAARPAGAKIKKKADGAAQPRARRPIPTSWPTLSKPGPQRPARWWASPPRPRTWWPTPSTSAQRKGCDWIVANDVSPAAGTFGGERNTVHLISASGVRRLADPGQGRGRRCGWPAASPCILAGRPTSRGSRMKGVETVEIEVVRLAHAHDLALPDYATAAAAGADLLAAIDQDIELAPLERKIVPTGISIALPVGFEAQVRPRSGPGGQERGSLCANSPGTIDADYRGESRRDLDQSVQGAVPRQSRHANCTVGRGAACPGRLA